MTKNSQSKAANSLSENQVKLKIFVVDFEECLRVHAGGAGFRRLAADMDMSAFSADPHCFVRLS